MADEDSRIYQDLMRFKPDRLSPNAWAVQSGVSRTVWSDMRRHGNPSRRTLEKLLRAVGSSLAEFEALRIGDLPRSGRAASRSELGEGRAPLWPGAALPPLPLLASEFSGELSASTPGIEMIEIHSKRVIARLPRPPGLALDGEAYALTTVGEAMWPRFRPGRRLAVSPGSPVAIGDDVVVQLKGSAGERLEERAMALVKELVGRTAGHVELRQFKPDVTFLVEASRIAEIHKVLGELI